MQTLYQEFQRRGSSRIRFAPPCKPPANHRGSYCALDELLDFVDFLKDFRQHLDSHAHARGPRGAGRTKKAFNTRTPESPIGTEEPFCCAQESPMIFTLDGFAFRPLERFPSLFLALFDRFSLPFLLTRYRAKPAEPAEERRRPCTAAAAAATKAAAAARGGGREAERGTSKRFSKSLIFRPPKNQWRWQNSGCWWWAL